MNVDYSIKAHLEDTLRILLSDTQNLRSLAKMSKLDIFTFYEGADLRGVDLGGQDLRGLSFSEADLRDANLGGVSYDLGAFNNSMLSSENAGMQDEFDGYLSDILIELLKKVYIFARFRQESLGACLAALSISTAELADSAGVSQTTIRKARKGQVVSWETACGIASSIQSKTIESSVNYVQVLSLSRQPMVELLADQVEGGFHHIDREELSRIVALAQRVTELRESREPSNSGTRFIWRDRPRLLGWYEDYYSRSDDIESGATLL